MSDKKMKSIFTKIVSGPIKPMKWEDVKKLLLWLGAKLRQSDGSARVFIINKRPLTIHKPHPDNELKRYAVRQVRNYLIKHDIQPKD